LNEAGSVLLMTSGAPYPRIPSASTKASNPKDTMIGSEFWEAEYGTLQVIMHYII
jgi:hypothetical protein